MMNKMGKANAKGVAGMARKPATTGKAKAGASRNAKAAGRGFAKGGVAKKKK